VEISIPFGRYELISRLAAGGMAELFVARQRSVSGFEKQLCIKRILAGRSQDDEFVRMFLDEARVAATLHHPNIVQIYDVGHVDDEYYIAMELIVGKNLVEIMRAGYRVGHRALPLQHTITVAAAVCDGLHHAHEKRDLDGVSLGIVHRDVTPQNVMVTYDGGVKLVDFGIAKATCRENQTAVGTLKGKLGYMSPEQCRGHAVDRRSDVFALGVVLYELTTGKRLYREKTEFETLKKIVDGPVPSPRELDPTLPAELDGIVSRCLQKSPDDRFQDARGVHMALDALARRLQLHTGTVALAHWMERVFPEAALARAGSSPVITMEAQEPSDTEAVPTSGYFGESSRRRVAPLARARRKHWVRRLRMGAAAAAIALAGATVALLAGPATPTAGTGGVQAPPPSEPVPAPAEAAPQAVTPAEPFDGAQLTGPGDVAPALISGPRPERPATALPLSPTIVCRILVDAEGNVVRSTIFRSRLELAAYEDAAIAAVQRYRFQPAQHGGKAVASWINWPVRFSN
jgi:serine/threonine-protein kinase